MEEEGPSSGTRKYKRMRVLHELDASEDNHHDEINHNDSVPESKEEESGLSVTLMDPEVLDCLICMEPLSPPVFQCENGHIACSACCTKLGNKCPSCSWPIGYNRCLAIEKVIESIKVSCEYKPYGCGETFSYRQKNTHEEKCIYAPCVCPISDCNFRGSTKQMSLHFSSQHWSSARRFRYNCPFSVSVSKMESYLVFQEENDGLLFVLINQIELIGSAITLVCLDPCSSTRRYDLMSKKEGSSLRLESLVKCVKEIPEEGSSEDFLLVPYGFYCSLEKLKLEICVWK
ncbi:E3 ubiquitin-protein ligase sina-like [Thalictrum thalictroides]|uniref:RING-type E3 ubiquitin transferase n=1 Tax=Thalictrum thalictroides TaxID=46969 RepID=A0A7J6VGE8_THATH|nr:E3 ubiquitin-protein ligase sina-like [Thalictrum thalictroides]